LSKVSLFRSLKFFYEDVYFSFDVQF
jgi:hypothetical protein